MIDEPPPGACLETSSPFGIRRQKVGDIEVGRDTVDLMFALTRHAELTWASGARTEVELAFVGVTAYLVESSPNPDFDLDVPVTCENRVRAIATARLTTSDGLLDETLPGVELNVRTTTVGNDPFLVARAVTTLERERARGSYAAQIPAGECLLALRFDLTLGQLGFDGTIVETAASTCDSNDPNGEVVERDAGGWHCPLGYCVSETNTALVVEADSCETIGAQLSGTEDEATFTRSGDTLTRKETWGCGCETYPSFVMAWAPRSPLELRLCEHDSRNTCLAACLGDLSYDLSTAFRASGASEFRFVE